LLLHPALLVGEGAGDVTAGEDVTAEDVGSEDDEDAGPDGGTVGVETGAEVDEAVAMGGLGVIERPLVIERLAVEGPVEPVGADGGLVAVLEADEAPEADEGSEPP